MKKHNYLNNKDILKEIHKSKMSYCSFLTPEDGYYDIILTDISQINAKTLEEGKQLRADRLAKKALDEEQETSGEKKKIDDFLVDINSIKDTDVVFRVMTWEHIPVDNSKKKQEEDDIPLGEYDEPEPKVPTKYTRVNFPPFHHYRLVEASSDSSNTLPITGLADYKLLLVGKSHWKGGLEGGEFCKTHGDMTKKLAHMIMKLCERYATRGNWRNYTYVDEMKSQALLQLAIVGLQFDENKSQNPFAYFTAILQTSFTRVLNIEKKNQNIRDDILEMNGLTPSYTRQGMGSWGGNPTAAMDNDD